jgi:hypothetical protein
MRIAFLFNHDQIHQVAHSLPVAVALANAGYGFEIVIATTNDRIAAEVRRLIGPECPPGIQFVPLTLKGPASRGLRAMFGKIVPAEKWLIYRNNLDFFRSLDALIVTERTSLALKTEFGLTTPKIILIDHGAGDRAIGFGPSTARFDHILAAGRKIRDRMIRDAGVAADNITITGYPKFDSNYGSSRPFKFQTNSRPIVLYNPHVSPHLSSWYKQGRAVLDYFLASDRYNLIFAPHIMLFERRIAISVDRLGVKMPGRLDRRHLTAPNIHVDLGSVALTNMTYTNCADLYLGDASSQVYEFLRTPRPCVFLNPHHIAYEGDPNFAHWQAGPVIESVSSLDAALDASIAGHASHYQPIQRRLFDYTFDLTADASSARAANAISGLLGLGTPQTESMDERLVA